MDDGREALYGGAVGGGKSAALLMAALQYVDVPGYAALILRRTFPQLTQPGMLIPLSKQWIGEPRWWNEQQKQWTFPSGAVLKFGHVEDETAALNYQGGAYHFVGFDELTQFSENAYTYIAFSRQRRTKDMADVGVPIRVRATANPGGIGHGWVKKRFIDNTTEPGRLFVPAKVADNPAWIPGEYEQSLMHLPDTLRRQLLEGDWGAFEGQAFQIERCHLVAPFPVPGAWDRFESMDYGINTTAWLAWAVDHEGNVIVFDEYYKGGVPSETAPAILARRKMWRSSTCYGDPASLAMPTTNLKFGAPTTIETEFADLGLPLIRANNEPRVGFTRLRELLRLDGDRLFPDWHPQRGQPGSPRMFVVEAMCPNLAEQLQAAPLQPIEKRWAGEMIDPDWEGPHGHAVAAARYGAMSRPAPSYRAEPWEQIPPHLRPMWTDAERMRAELLAETRKRWEERDVSPQQFLEDV